jgi:hypothetical protein
MTKSNTRKDGRGRNLIDEQEHKVLKLLKWLPAGPTADGEGHRKKDLVQFVAAHGGVRTVAADDLVVLR